MVAEACSNNTGQASASADVGLMFVAYNIRRLINILGNDKMKKYLEQVAYSFLNPIHKIWLNLRSYKSFKFIKRNIEGISYHPLKTLKYDPLLIKIE